MIVYDNREVGGTILHLTGSVFYGMLPLAFFMAAMCLAIVYADKHYIYSEVGIADWAPVLEHPFSASLLSGTVSFALVWRISLAWARYWDACNQSSVMYSKWADSYATLISFINSAQAGLKDDSTESGLSKKEQLQELRVSLAHNFSLLSALAVHRLTRGDLARMKRRSEKLGMRSSWFCCIGLFRLCRNRKKLFTSRTELRFHDVTGAFDLPSFNVIDVNADDQVVQAPMTRKSFETMESLNDVSSFMFSSNHGDQEDEAPVRKRVSNVTWSSGLFIVGELTGEEQSELNAQVGAAKNPDRPNILFEWISEDMNALVKLCGIPPPIMSRCYQELSNGMLGFNQSLKMADIPFPFLFTQLMEIIIRTFTMILPVYVARFTQGIVLSPVLTFGITLALWTLKEISTELENPFSDGANQLPIIDMHERFVEKLRILFHLRPHRS